MNLRDIVKKKKLNITTKEAVASHSIVANVPKEASDSSSPVLQQIWNDKILKIVSFLIMLSCRLLQFSKKMTKF